MTDGACTDEQILDQELVMLKVSFFHQTYYGVEVVCCLTDDIALFIAGKQGWHILLNIDVIRVLVFFC